ncbi:hypothetical protein [Halocatena halophila]|uniref:hypothetical protein n=1 Tax=Halocatena halophila TaxID=2814576 RepID=UPI002ED4728E
MNRSFRHALLPAVVGIFVFLPIYGTYYLTHPYPSLGGGLFLMMGQEIVTNGFAIPPTVPYYTAGGIPLGYPPLMLTIAGGLVQLGFSPFVVARVMPGLLMVCALIAFGVAAKTVLESRFQAAIAVIVFVTSPPVLEFTVTAGGTVRAAAMVLSCSGIYTAVRMYRTGNWTWIIATAALFGATIQTHPLYTIFFGTNVAALWLGTDRTLRGLAAGGTVAAGGVVLAAPWWLTIADVHGVELFFTASSTHGGVGYFDWYRRLLKTSTVPASPWPVVSLVAAGVLVVRRRPAIPFWLVSVGFLTGRDEYLLVIGAMAIATAFTDELLPIVNGVSVPWERSLTRNRVAEWTGNRIRSVSGESQGILTILALFCLFVGTAYGGATAMNYVDGTQSDPALPMYVQGSDMKAAEWIKTHTHQEASFVVIGDVAEWFPLISDRTSLIVPQGAEWNGQRTEQIELRSSISTCRTTVCLTNQLEAAELSPKYIYLSRAGYHDDAAAFRWQSLGFSLETDQSYSIVYENDNVIIAERISA